MRIPQQSYIPRRQGFLLLIAILIPCLVLVALGLLMISYERQLEDRRLAEERKLQAAQVGQELLLLLDTIQRQEMARSPIHDREESEDLEDAVAFSGTLVEGRLRLPWEDKPGALRFRELLNAPYFAPAFRKAEVAELERRQYGDAVLHYRQAIEAAAHLPQLSRRLSRLLPNLSIDRASVERVPVDVYTPWAHHLPVR